MGLDTWRINLKSIRTKLDKNQSYIASQLGKTQQTIGNWESGIGEPNISELIKITNLFGISLDDFIKNATVTPIVSSSKGGKSVLNEAEADYTTATNMVQTLSVAVRALDAANLLLQNKVSVLEEENVRLKKKSAGKSGK